MGTITGIHNQCIQENMVLHIFLIHGNYIHNIYHPVCIYTIPLIHKSQYSNFNKTIFQLNSFFVEVMHAKSAKKKKKHSHTMHMCMDHYAYVHGHC